MNVFELKQGDLVSEFDQYLLEHPEFAKTIPAGAHVMLQVEGDDAYNRWAARTAKQNAEPGHPIVTVTIKRLEPIRSRIAEAELTPQRIA